MLFEASDQSLDPVALPVSGLVEVGLTRLVLAGWNDRLDPALPEAATGRRTGVAPIPGGSAGTQARSERGTAPLSISASNANCSWRSPAVSTAAMGLPPPSARRCSLVENPPWLRPSASPIPSTVPSPPDGAGPACTGGVLVGAHHRSVHEVQVPAEMAPGIGSRLQLPKNPIEHAGLLPAIEPARHGPDSTVASR